MKGKQTGLRMTKSALNSQRDSQRWRDREPSARERRRRAEREGRNAELMICRRCGAPVDEMVGTVPPGGTATNRPCGHKAGITMGDRGSMSTDGEGTNDVR